MEAFNLGYVYSYDFFFFFQKSNRCFVSRLQDSEVGNLSERKYNEVSQEVVIDNNKANLELLIQAFLYKSHFFQLILSVQLIDIHTRSVLNVTILLSGSHGLPETIDIFCWCNKFSCVLSNKWVGVGGLERVDGNTCVCLCWCVYLHVSMWAVDLCA